MSTAAFIRRHITQIPPGQIFTTREFLLHGSRPAVDQTLYRLVKAGLIQRLARGVFIVLKANEPFPTPLAVCAVKSRAFGKQVFRHGFHAAADLGFLPEAMPQPIFVTTGRSSSFRYGESTIQLKGIAPRKVITGDSTIGLIIRALWHLGKKAYDQQLLSVLAAQIMALSRSERQALRRAAGLMPAWMTAPWSKHWSQVWTGDEIRRQTPAAIAKEADTYALDVKQAAHNHL